MQRSEIWGSCVKRSCGVGDTAQDKGASYYSQQMDVRHWPSRYNSRLALSIGDYDLGEWDGGVKVVMS